MAISANHISKSYEGRTVLRDVSVCLEDGGIYCLMGPSGIGKTTLLRILLGLEEPDGAWEAERLPHGRVGVVFQENRLCDFAGARRNILLTAGRDGLLFPAEEILDGLLEREAWDRPVRSLSGGMQRRAAIARALAARSSLLLMDEPFAGLDMDTKERTIRKILDYRAGRTLLVVTHQEEDAEMLGAEVLRLM